VASVDMRLFLRDWYLSRRIFAQVLRNLIVRLEYCHYFADYSQSFRYLLCDVMQGYFRSCYDVIMLRHIRTPVRTVLASFTAAAAFSLITSI
jgi:hypothetical protein